ncbi:DUF2807 domain-containing protein [Bacteroides sp. 519]|nr:DUF2807 domain-containing protein [Bacteroides sp. 519]
MKTYTFFQFVIVLCLLALSVCGCVIAGEGITPSKTYITRNYKVSEFSNIDVTTVGDVYYVQSKDATTSVEIYGPDNIVELFEASIDNNTLYLTMKKKNRVRNVKKMKIMISTPQLYSLNFNGVGNVYINDGLTTTNFTVSQQGVGDVNIHSLTCEEVTVNSTGVGDTKIDGTANIAILSARGVGNIDAVNLEAKTVNASSQGVGNISCHATESISAAVQGVGNIQYKGSPQEKKINKSGIGSIKQL